MKLIELFVDPCYLSLCSISDYSTGGGAGTNKDSGACRSPSSFRRSYSCRCVSPASRIYLYGRSGAGSAITGRCFPPMAEMTIAATGIVVGYAGSTLTGPAHLRYGFARDFVLPALLSAVVAVTLGSVALWYLVARRRVGRGLSPETRFVAVSPSPSPSSSWALLHTGARPGWRGSRADT